MTATLNQYLQQVQRFTRDTKQELLAPSDLVFYINMARREVAMRGQCIRFLTPNAGAIISASITNGGTRYSNPSLVISTPDQPSGALPFPNGDQATGTATQAAGVINNVFIAYGGAGYFQPALSIADPTGSGAVITPTVAGPFLLNPGQEVYAFRDVDTSSVPGCGAVYTVRSVSILYTNYRYSVPIYSFTRYQASIRQYTIASYQYVPCFGSQFGRGTDGSFYLYPPPSQAYQMEWDCSCLPQDLATDLSQEAIPDPWTDLVPYYAAHLAYLELQNHNLARSYLAMFDERMTRFGSYVDKGRAVNPYGRP